MVLNSGKYRFICFGKNTENETYFFNNTEVKNSSEDKILGITIDNKLKGNAQILFLCNPQKSPVNVFLMKILKSTVTKKVIVCFCNLGEENF